MIWRFSAQTRRHFDEVIVSVPIPGLLYLVSNKLVIMIQSDDGWFIEFADSIRFEARQAALRLLPISVLCLLSSPFFVIFFFCLFNCMNYCMYHRGKLISLGC